MDSRETVTVSERCEVLMCSDKGSLRCIGAEDLVILRTSETGKARAFLGPVTPDINGEFRDSIPDLKFQLTQPNKLGHLDSSGNINSDDESPHTPKGDAFDPFAPGSDDLLLAPCGKKQLNEWRISVARRLNFGCSTEKLHKRSHEGNGTRISDEEMVETVYKILLETILENKMEDILAEMSSREWADEDCRTPTSVPKLNGVAETCPGAPVKAAAKSRNIELSLCRKLQF